MTSFISIIHTEDGGLASYTINDNKDHYKAALIKCTTAAAVPHEVVIERNLNEGINNQVSDPVKNKLIHAIKKTEEDGEEFA
ncbi:MAG: hypothetical protein ACM3VS_06550 [Candidatus Dadabacteria bacterium]